MNTSRSNDVITITLTVEEAAILAAEIAPSRAGAMAELYERLLGSPAWRHKHQPGRAHAGVIDTATYERVLDREHL